MKMREKKVNTKNGLLLVYVFIMVRKDTKSKIVTTEKNRKEKGRKTRKQKRW